MLLCNNCARPAKVFEERITLLRGATINSYIRGIMTPMTIRDATYADIPALMEIYRQAREIQLESGNLHQWAEGHPGEELVRKDISGGFCHVVERDGSPVGAFALIFGADPTYSHIEGGSWLDDTVPYATIHRLGSLKGAGGVARACFDWCWERVRNLRVDTHEDNAIMRHCILKAGFTYCGIIHLLNGDPRLAYQKIGPEAVADERESK